MKTTSGSVAAVSLTVALYSVIAGFLVLGLWGPTSALSQTSSAHKKVSTSASTGLNVSTVNGQSEVTLNGKQVYAGPTQGHVTSSSRNVNGVEYSAVYDGDTVLWENVPGAAQQLQSTQNAPAGQEHKQFMDQHQQTVERMKEEQRKFMEEHGGTNIAHGSGSGSHSGGSVSTGGGAHGKSGGSSQGFSGGQSGGHSESRSTSQSGNVSISTKTVNGSTVITYQGKEIPVRPTQGQVSTKTKSTQGKDYAVVFDGDRVIWENVPGAAQQVITRATLSSPAQR